jgi:phosphoglycerate dehydrogenase-like enzyme
MNVAVLDDYQGVALELADWTPVEQRASVTVFRDHLFDEDALVERLVPFEVICVMRERTPLPRRILERLPKLKLICSTGERNASIDGKAAGELGITIAHTRYVSNSTIELTWALILSLARQITAEANSVRHGGWQVAVGEDLQGKVLGVLGLGRIGTRVALIARAFDMEVIAWSANLTPERAADAGAKLVSKAELFRSADFLTIHLVLSERTRGLVGASELAAMKRSAYLINTSRGPIVDETALVPALLERRIAGAALDTFDIEPLRADHPFRILDNVLATPHIGYVTRAQYELFFRDTVKNIETWLGLHS